MFRLVASITLGLAAMTLVGCGGSASADGSVSQDDAVMSATLAWLALMDAGEYEQTWDTAADIFKSRVSQEDWGEFASNSRGAFGKLVARRLQNSVSQLELTGEMEYVIRFGADFEKRNANFEMLTTTLESDRTWRVGSYFLR